MMTTRTVEPIAEVQSEHSVPPLPGTSGGKTTVVTMTTDAKSLFSEKSVFKMDDDDEEEGNRKWWRVLGGMFTLRKPKSTVEYNEEPLEATNAATEAEDGGLRNMDAKQSRKWIWLLVGIAAVAVMALVVGLAVGLTKKSRFVDVFLNHQD
jgi:hypothetical protein